MSRNIGPTVEILMRRVRQEGGLAVAPDFATQIYSRCEQITNAALERVLVTDTLSTPKEKLLFNFRDAFPDAISIVEIEQSNRTLFECKKATEFTAFQTTWFRNITGTRFEAWMQLGRDLLFLYPGQVATSSVTVKYAQLLTLHTDFAASYDTASELPDEDVDLALALAEVVLLTRFRLLRNVPDRLKAAMKLFTERGFALS